MEDLTFGEQVKIILGRKGMTIKHLAELIELRTGKKMSRQNLTQRLGRDNFQEQDMRMIAEILECPFQLSIMGGESPVRVSGKAQGRQDDVQETTVLQQAQPGSKAQELSRTPESAQGAAPGEQAEAVQETDAVQYEQSAEFVKDSREESSAASGAVSPDERDMTIGELYDIHQELSEMEESIKAGEPAEKAKEELEKKKSRFRPGGIFLRRKHTEETSQKPEEEEIPAEVQEEISEDIREMDEAAYFGEEQMTTAAEEQAEEEFEPVIPRKDSEEDTEVGDINPYTGREYQSNSVRMHPSRIGYVQVYDRSIHKWTDMTEWAFLGYQERKKTLLGNAYEPPIYLD